MTRPPTHRGRMSLTRALVWMALTYVVTMVGYLGIHALASRWLGAPDYAVFAVILTAATFLGQLALLGAHRGGLREAAQLTEDPDDPRLRLLYRGARGSEWLTLPLAGVAAFAASYPFFDGSTTTRLLLAAGFGVIVWTSGLQKLWSSYLRGLGALRLSSLVEGRSGGTLVSVLQAGLLVAIWLAAPQLGLTGAVFAMAVGFAVPVLYAGRVARRRWAHLTATSSRWRDVVDSARLNWRFSINQVAVYLSSAVDIWIAAALLAPVESGQFAAAHRLAMLIAIPLTAVQPVFAPVAARMLANGELTQVERVMRSGASVAALGAGLLLVPMLVAPQWMMTTVFGSEFAGGAFALFLLSLGNLANVLTGFCGTALTMSHHEGLVARTQAISVVVRVVSGAAAGAAYGLTGLAIASAVVTCATFTVNWWQARRYLGINTHPTLRPSLAALRRTPG